MERTLSHTKFILQILCDQHDSHEVVPQTSYSRYTILEFGTKFWREVPLYLDIP